MNLRQIEVFRAVMLTGTISGAAQLLHISPPAVSRLISYTEVRLRMPLFQRIKGRLCPTPQAQALFHEVEGLYQHARRVQQSAQAIASQAQNVLRIACSPSLAYALMPCVMARFGQMHPDVEISLESMLSGPLTDAVLTQRVDLAVAIVPLQGPRIRVHDLLHNRIVAVLPDGHRLLSQKLVPVGDMHGERFIAYSPETPLAHAIDRLFDGARVTPKRVATVRQTHIACALVSQGMGLALVDEQALLGDCWHDLPRRPIHPSIDLHVRAGYLAQEPLSRLAQEFLTELENIAGQASVTHP